VLGEPPLLGLEQGLAEGPPGSMNPSLTQDGSDATHPRRRTGTNLLAVGHPRRAAPPAGGQARVPPFQRVDRGAGRSDSSRVR
jgi:hypothetical protein